MSLEKYIANVSNAKVTAGEQGRPHRIGCVDYKGTLKLSEIAKNVEGKFVRQVVLEFPAGISAYETVGKFVSENKLNIKDVYFYDRPSTNELQETITRLLAEVERLKANSTQPVTQTSTNETKNW
jgi:uncharacterized small protein (DUF1192 family)